MFRLWGKEWKDNHLVRDTVICDDTEDTRTHKIFHALDEICYQFDLSKPIWLDSTIEEFKRHDKARFYPEPWCFEAAPEEDKTLREFPFTPEGLEEAIRWLNASYEEKREYWKECEKNKMRF